MANVQFGFTADMRLEQDFWGISELIAFDAFMTNFVPVREERLEETSTRVVVRSYNAAGDSLTLTAIGNFSAGRLTYLAAEGDGVLVEFRGNFLVDAAGNLLGGLGRIDAFLTADDSMIIAVSGLNVPFSGTLPDLSDAAVFSGADVMAAGPGDDYLLGYGGADSLSGGGGNDTLDGGTGADELTGGVGNDLYRVDSELDQISEDPGGGIDTVRSTATYKLDPNLEQLTLRGIEDIDGAGNRMANIILGNRGDNGLNGGLGADTVIGGSGADSLTGGSGRDTLAGEESPDTLLGGIGADSLAGGLGSDRLMGGTNADTLDGGPGRDTLTGDGGADRFDFDTALANTNVDRIVDFSATNDLIHLDIDIFNGIALGALHAGAFRSGAGASTAQDANDRIVYDTSTGCLYYDGDGAGGAGATLFAIAEGAPAMAATNFFIAI